MEFKQIEAFINVIKYKSFSKAADASFLTQPTISTHISSLEKELGVTLIDRLGKESRPTKQGREFYKYAINMINTREKAIYAMGEMGKEVSGIVELQASSIPGQYILPALMSRFREEFPAVRFYLEQSDSSVVWNHILENKGELGFTGEYKNNSLGCELLCKDTCVLITPRTEKFLALHEAAGSIAGEDFLDEPFVWREEGSATRNTFEEKAYRKRGEKLKIAATLNSLEAIKQCVSGGLGVSIVSQVVTEGDSEDAGYLTFELADIHLEREFYLVYNRNMTLSPVAMQFRNYVLEYFEQRGKSKC